jgi:hypothetical protein
MSRLRRRRPVEHPGDPTPCQQPSNSRSALPEVVRAAERIVYAEKWRACEEQAAIRLSGTRSVCWTRLFPNSPVIVVVAVHGVVIGHVRRSGKHWLAVLPDHARPVATRRTRRGAIAELAWRAPGPSRMPRWCLWARSRAAS